MDGFQCLMNAAEWWFPQVDLEYPGSKFIWTHRPKDQWMESIHRHFRNKYLQLGDKVFEQHNHLITFGCYLFNEDRFSWVYDLHEKTVKDYFSDRPEDLFSVDLSKERTVDRLCEFLGVEPQGLPYPRLNIGVNEVSV
jgi:hypothetical protein